MNAERPFLTARWHSLLILSYEIDPRWLEPYVPAGTEVDSWNGRTFISVVGFRFVDTRVRGIAVPFHRDFDEVNLRFYVRRAHGEKWRRGVAFLRELVPRRAIAWVANQVYGERYRALSMRHEVVCPEAASERGVVRYQWSEGQRWSGIRATIAGMPRPLEPVSEEEFITEHYWGYAARDDRTTLEYRVEHPSWRIWHARDAAIEGELDALCGPILAEALRQPPASALVAEGSAVEVHRGQRIRRDADEED